MPDANMQLVCCRPLGLGDAGKLPYRGVGGPLTAGRARPLTNTSLPAPSRSKERHPDDDYLEEDSADGAVSLPEESSEEETSERPAENGQTLQAFFAKKLTKSDVDKGTIGLIKGDIEASRNLLPQGRQVPFASRLFANLPDR